MPRREAALWPRPGSLYFSSPRFLSSSTWSCPPDLPFSAGVLSPFGFRRPPCGRAVRVRFCICRSSRVGWHREPRALAPRRVLSRATPPLVIAAAQPFPLPVLASACAPLSIALADRAMPAIPASQPPRAGSRHAASAPACGGPDRWARLSWVRLLAITGIIASKNVRSFSTDRRPPDADFRDAMRCRALYRRGTRRGGGRPTGRLLRRGPGGVQPNTERALRADVEIFAAWCRQHVRVAFPASAATVIAFIDDMARIKAPATVRGVVA